ncbi:hypothetical protein I4U23_004155 [Adineta vaga]|nr:hypothetical protein I4U23_004155 [Adineta vaga]
MVFVLIVVTNLLNICILCSRTLRVSPCTYYFIGYAIIIIIYSYSVCPTQVKRPLVIAMLVLDLFCSSSKSHRLHSTSTERTARITVIIIRTIVITVYIFSKNIYREQLRPLFQFTKQNKRSIHSIQQNETTNNIVHE